MTSIIKTEVIREDGKLMWFVEEYQSHTYTIKQTTLLTDSEGKK